jgi:glycosyltransferase involved in cell wall biosynthesis
LRAVIVFDVSRLIACAARVTPSGIERVELAYARHLLAGTTPRCFVRITRCGRLALLPQPAVERYVEALAALWRFGSSLRRRASLQLAVLRLRAARPLRRRWHTPKTTDAATKPVYLVVSHHHLEKRRLISRLKRRHGMFFACLVHDLIPIEFPEYARPGQDVQHRRRIETVAALADAVVVPSAATAVALRPWINSGKRDLPIIVAPFGVEPPASEAAGPALPERPYFVCLGTIEARKNHLLLLNLWRDFVARNGARAPALVLIGRRGWEIENTIDMLDRCPAVRGNVWEHSTASDAQAMHLLKNARALLLPAHAEGFGFPLIEALACGIPVLCSDIPAFREIGGAVPEYLDPLDGGAWRAAILDYAADPSPRREAQLRRLALWQPPRWTDHFAAIEGLVAKLTARPANIDP